jgi:hypothetical protein
MSAIKIGLTRSGARQEDRLRINATILSAFEVGSAAAIDGFFVYNSPKPNNRFLSTLR